MGKIKEANPPEVTEFYAVFCGFLGIAEMLSEQTFYHEATKVVNHINELAPQYPHIESFMAVVGALCDKHSPEMYQRVVDDMLERIHDESIIRQGD